MAASAAVAPAWHRLAVQHGLLLWLDLGPADKHRAGIVSRGLIQSLCLVCLHPLRNHCFTDAQQKQAAGKRGPNICNTCGHTGPAPDQPLLHGIMTSPLVPCTLTIYLHPGLRQQWLLPARANKPTQGPRPLQHPPAEARHASMNSVEGLPQGRPSQAHKVPRAGHTSSATHVLHKQVRIIHLQPHSSAHTCLVISTLQEIPAKCCVLHSVHSVTPLHMHSLHTTHQSAPPPESDQPDLY
jgi:hypothetical protein